MALTRRLALAFTFVLAGIALATGAERLSAKQQKDALEWAANNSLFVLYHEVGHLLVDQLGLPVLGKEEDAADNMASYTLLQKHTRAADKAITDAAYGWLLTGQAYTPRPDDSDYYASHSLDRQRAFQIVCLMVGSNPSAFGKIADEYRIDNDRQEECEYDWKRLKASMEGVLRPYSSKNARSTEVTITYHAASGKLKTAADAFKKSGVFEQVADQIKAQYGLRNKVTLRAKRCGEANAFYDPDTVEVTFCYELMDDFVQLIKADMPEESERTAPPPSTGFGRSPTAAS
ncbi:DUF4344 domain-containing metallopeptidase [Paradevosia shaoguanensis]|uniref:DUF4344 domain-containing metallopeptidase n=1 Tax=Paradevosia shaoguanensis TaxID=1335043 RepID=A0AA41QLB4_9HYPH|nr:DUF4344 domain-containing metallopeptidase [Paradevosia shaoguanensis]MCF1742137.1 DUF4344 domain-containing metallopeptidase [Paradevosia shaoguanensis]MCI0126620.1 DUF4344 domain-containing metallopeptidase [Paradevosia shaoguanensis]